MNENNINNSIAEIESYFKKLYGNVNFSFWLSGDVYFNHNSDLLIFAASTTKIAYFLFFINQLNENQIHKNTPIKIQWNENLFNQLYKLIVKNEKVDPYINEIYLKCSVTEKELINSILDEHSKYKDSQNIKIPKIPAILLNKTIKFETLLKLIFSNSSNLALDLLVEYYKNKNIRIQDETQKIVDRVLGPDNKTVINNSYKEKDLWNVSTLAELIEIYAFFLKACINYPFLKQYLNRISNKYIEFNSLYRPILLEKSGWYPDYPINKTGYNQIKLFTALNLNNYRYSTFINCLSYNPDKDRYIGYCFSVGHNDEIGTKIIKESGKVILDKLIEFI